jgi:hypothetical protein
MVMQANTLKQEEIQDDFRSWIFQVFTGDLEIISTIREHLAMIADERTMHSAVLGPVAKTNVYYQIQTNSKPVVYVRCDPQTYEMFAVEQQHLLPACPELGSDLKIGRAANLQNRENTNRENGVFVFFVSLECTDDSTMLENVLKEKFQSQRSSTGTEYYDLRNLKNLFEEQHARGVLEQMKGQIRSTIAELSFLFTLHVTIYTANDVYENRDGIAVTFTLEVVPVRGRLKDQDYQAIVAEKMVLVEENQVLGKHVREQGGGDCTAEKETAHRERQRGTGALGLMTKVMSRI